MITRNRNGRRLAVILLAVTFTLAVALTATFLHRRVDAVRFASLQEGMTFAEVFSVLRPGERPDGLPPKPHFMQMTFFEDRMFPPFVADLAFDDEGHLEEKKLLSPSNQQILKYWWYQVLSLLPWG